MKKLFFVAAVLLSFVLFFTACSSNANSGAAGKSEQSALLTADSAYTCTMHHEVIGTHTGDCPKCGMHLVKQPLTPEQERMI